MFETNKVLECLYVYTFRKNWLYGLLFLDIGSVPRVIFSDPVIFKILATFEAKRDYLEYWIP
jgi:hypothetical protein